jgi:hypothetical protein
MTRRTITSWLAVAAIAAATAAITRPSAQVPAGVPIPRTADGKPNFAGVWQVLNTAAWNIQDHSAEYVPGIPIQFAIPAGRGVVEGNEIPYNAAGLAKQRENLSTRAKADPESKCFLPGVPRIMYTPFPFQIVQTPRQVSMLFEYVHATRNVFMDSPHPKGPIEWWMGDSRGRWDGDTLVVDVVHFNDQTWLDRAGNFLTPTAHLVERYRLMTPDHIAYEVTVEDPAIFTRPWKMSMPLYRRMEPTAQILDFECYTFGEDGALSFGPKG